MTSVAGRALRDAGIRGDGAAHLLRHTAACGVLTAGGGLAEAGLLRHAGPEVDCVYAGSPMLGAALDRPAVAGRRTAMSTTCARPSGPPGRAPCPRLPARRTERCPGRSWTACKPAGETRITVPAALAFATAPPGTARVWHAQRLAAVRSFAGYVHGLDPAAADPVPDGLIPPGPPAGSLTCIPARSPPGSWPRPVRCHRRSWLPACGRSSGCWPAPIRSGEARALDAPDLDTAGQVLTVTGKHGRSPGSSRCTPPRPPRSRITCRSGHGTSRTASPPCSSGRPGAA